ncbi:MAG: nitrogenase component 1 [Candidatus Malihini olakiniferum]
MMQENWNQPTTDIPVLIELGITDKFLIAISNLTSFRLMKQALTLKRGRLLDMMLSSYTWLYGKRFGLYGHPDFVMGLT